MLKKSNAFLIYLLIVISLKITYTITIVFYFIIHIFYLLDSHKSEPEVLSFIRRLGKWLVVAIIK